MKKEFKHALLILSLMIFAPLSFSGQHAASEPAIETSKQTSEYSGLKQAFKVAVENRLADDAVGQTAKLFAADGASFDEFGFSVSISGNTAIVGAYGASATNADQGVAYIFVRTNSIWSFQQKLTASDGAVNDLFGFGVAIDGDTVVVGAAQDNIGMNDEQGSAYIFVRSGTTWTEQQKLVASDGDANDFFGENVSIDGDTVVVGAYGGNIAADEHRGSAYVFVRSGTTWTQQQRLTASDGQINDGLGFDVAIDGDTVIAGAWHDEIGGNNSQGSAYVFTRSGTTWTQQQKLIASDGSAADTFGISVAIENDTAIVGAFFGTVGGVRRGSAYVFVRSATVWTEQQKLFASDGSNGDEFGRSVAISGNTAIVGAGDDDGGSNIGQGSAYIFTRNGTTWTEQQRLIASDRTSGAHFGVSVATSGNKIIVGAVRADVSMSSLFGPEAEDQGAAYVFVSKFSVSGRVLAPDGVSGVSNATVQMTLANGGTLTSRSSSFGYYRFDDVEADQTVTMSVNSKRFQFTPQMVMVNGNLVNVDLIAQP